jgi:hypothetical protein
MRAYRSLRWTHEVRQTAARTLGVAGARLARMDRVLDRLSIVPAICAVALVVAEAA